MIKKALMVTTGGMVLGCALSDTFARKVDRNLIRPMRNYHSSLYDYNSFKTPEDFKFFLQEMGNGIVNFFRINESNN